MLRSRGERPARFQRSPRTTSWAYFSSAGATTRTSSDFVMGFAPSMVVCSAADAPTAIRQNENKVAASNLTVGFLRCRMRHQQPRDQCGTEHGDGAGEKEGVQARPGRDQSKRGARKTLGQIEKGGVGSHRQAAALCRHAANCFDTETGVDQREA